MSNLIWLIIPERSRPSLKLPTEHAIAPGEAEMVCFVCSMVRWGLALVCLFTTEGGHSHGW